MQDNGVRFEHVDDSDHIVDRDPLVELNGPDIRQEENIGSKRSNFEFCQSAGVFEQDPCRAKAQTKIESLRQLTERSMSLRLISGKARWTNRNRSNPVVVADWTSRSRLMSR